MKKLNESQFLHVKSQIYDSEFHVPRFLCCTQNYPLFYCSPPPIKESLPFHQPTPVIIISPSLTSNPPTIRRGRVVETRDDKLHVKFDNSKNLENLEKTVDLTSNLD